ncbi:transposase, partial [Virgibacillus halodenitrificans]|nr:transposase [Virgibacillus halodenitrificans]
MRSWAAPQKLDTISNTRRSLEMSKFTEAIKLQVVKEYASGKFSYRELAKYYEVDESVIRYWELLYRHHGENAFNFTYTNYPAAFKLEVIKFINEKNYSIREASA